MLAQGLVTPEREREGEREKEYTIKYHKLTSWGGIPKRLDLYPTIEKMMILAKIEVNELEKQTIKVSTSGLLLFLL